MGEMGIYETMRTQRAVRRLRPDPIPDDVLRRVLEAASWAPTGGNVQPWRVIVVKDRERKERLGALYSQRWTIFAKRYRQMATALPPDVRDRTLRTVSAGDYLADHFGQTPVIAIFCFNPTQMAITDANLQRVSV